MLVLTRKSGDRIKIGKDIIISILEIEGKNVKIGIDAPKEVVILRLELLEKIQKENIDSASKKVDDISDLADMIKNKFSTEKKH
ncbi:MAG: carbon storage regulator CsrA [Desulfobacteraceae bacterium]|nr:carbon storage regulator CsrA [Desulfobacteraceae bacterium]